MLTLNGLLWWADTGQQLSCLLTPPPCRGMGERIGREKVRKLMHKDKDSLTSEGKKEKNKTKHKTPHDAKAIARYLPQAD